MVRRVTYSRQTPAAARSTNLLPIAQSLCRCCVESKTGTITKRESTQRRSGSPATHNCKAVVHRLLLLFNLLLRLLQRNSRLRFLLKLGDFVALSNTANGRRRAEWKHREAWPRRAYL